MKYITKSEKQTIALGKKIAKTLKGGEILALSGDLGAGKTTLIKGIAQGLGIKKIITSPTFVLMKVYNVANGKWLMANGKQKRAIGHKLQAISHKPYAISQLVHIDCYRIKSPQEILDIGANEYFGKEDTVVVIEWADKIKKILSKNLININLSLGKNLNERKIELK